MILGVPVTGQMVVVAGLVLFSLLVFQLLVGPRVIKFGRKTSTVHRWFGFGIVAFALFHGVLGMALALGLQIL